MNPPRLVREAAGAIQHNIDLFRVLRVPWKADEAAVKKGYKARALELHPDRNPKHPQAKQLWELTCLAKEILLDEFAREFYISTIERLQARARQQQIRRVQVIQMGFSTSAATTSGASTVWFSSASPTDSTAPTGTGGMFINMGGRGFRWP